MPNGHDKNWVRFCGAVDGFRARYEAWPTRMRMLPGILGNLESLFDAAALAAIRAKVELVPDAGAGMIAEDAVGRSYDYGARGFPRTPPDVRAWEWLGVRPKPHDEADA